jgi:hypothetical protein
MSDPAFCKPPPTFGFEECIKKHNKEETFTKECSLKHPRAKERSWVLRRVFDVPSILMQTI